jgi:hypothetical protein
VRRWIAAGLVAVAVLGGLVALGRWERSHNAARQNAGMREVERLVGPLDSPSLSGYRVMSGFDCLVYRRGRNAFALELCANASGRLVEAIDRRKVERRIFSLRTQPSLATNRIDLEELDSLLSRMGAKT